MEINNTGIIGVLESRDSVNAMKEYYQTEYRKIKAEQKETNINYFKNKWKVRIGQFALNVGLVFTSAPIKFLGRVVTNIIGGITKKVMQIKNKLYNKRVERKLKKLEADFINVDGEFKQFEIENNSEIEYIPEFKEQAMVR